MLKILLFFWLLGQTQAEAFRDALQVTVQPAPVVLPLAPQALPPASLEPGRQVWTHQSSGSRATLTLTVVP